MPGSDSSAPQGTSAWEWVVAAVGAAILLGTIGYMSWYGISRPNGAPALTIQQIETIPQSASFLVRIRVRNDGYSTAASVLVGGELKQSGEPLEASEATIDYVPERSDREAALQFTRDPAAYDLELRIKGLAKP